MDDLNVKTLFPYQEIDVEGPDEKGDYELHFHYNEESSCRVMYFKREQLAEMCQGILVALWSE